MAGEIQGIQQYSLTELYAIKAKYDELLKSQEDGNEEYKKTIENLKNIEELITKAVAIREQSKKDLELENQLLQQNEGFLASRNLRLESYLAQQKNILEQEQINLDIEKEKLKAIRDTKDVNSEEYQNALQSYVQQVKDLEIKKKSLEISEKLGQQTKDIISATTGISARWKETFFGKLLDKDSDSIKNMTVISKSIKDTINIQNVVGSTLMKIQEATAVAFQQYDQAATGIAKVAGANSKLLDVLEKTSRGSTVYGISFQQAGKAIESLYGSLNTFTNLSKVSQEQLTISVAKLDKLGISGDQAAKQIGTLTQIMGMSEVQAGKTSEQLAGFALAIGKSPQQISQDFAGASNQLAAYGNNMINVFKDLEAQSKATGVALGDLISIAEKFQTFEGAAQAAGKLNAALGGGFINAMELLEASAQNPAAAIDLLRTRLNEAGMSFDQMSFYEKKMIADAAGFKTIEEASRVLSMTNAEAEKAAKADAERANQQKLVNEAIERAIPIQEKLSMIAANFAIVMGPVVDGVSLFLSGMTKIIDEVPYVNYLLGTLLVIIGGFYIITKGVQAFQALTLALKTLGIVSSTVAPAAAPVAGAMETVGVAGLSAAPGITAFGVSIFTVVGTFALAAVAIGLMAAGIGYLIKSFIELFGVLNKTDGIADNLVKLGLSMQLVGLMFANPIAMVGLLVFSTALSTIVSTLNQLDANKSLNFSVITKSISDLNVNTVTGPNSVMKETGELIKAINEFKLDNTSTGNLERILKAAIPQQQQPPTINMTPTFIVKIGNKTVEDVVVETVGKTFGGSPATGTAATY